MNQNELAKETFDRLVSEIKINENFVPRNYKTIGGMWTVETWAKEDFKVQMMDEGYTLVLLKMNADEKIEWTIMRNYKNDLIFERISEEEFVKDYSIVNKNTSKNKM